MKYEDLTKEQLQFIRKTGKCPDCEGDLYEGPCGGMMMNVHCGTCDARFNITNPELLGVVSNRGSVPNECPMFGQRLSFDNTGCSKVLFCDIDGVLNSHLSFVANHEARTAAKEAGGNELATEFIWPLGHLSVPLIERLNTIVEKTGCYIVLSSSWRIICELNSLRGWLEQKGFAYPHHLIDKTDNIPDDARGVQIQRWLDSHPDIKQYAILDDDSEDIIGSYTTKTHPNNFVHTNFMEGLQDAQVEKVVEILNKTVDAK